MSDRPDPSAANSDQIAYWNSGVGERWAAMQARTDAVFGPLTQAALDHAAPGVGERVIDVGCGCGETVLALADRVGPHGSVFGVDVSAPMLDLARTRIEAAGLEHIRVALDDAATHRFEPAASDLVFSRFGVMFFDDPVAAFTNIRTALASSGRLVFVCWQPLADNPWFSVPVAALKPFAPPQPPADPLAPGPFAFADPNRVRAILGEAGFKAIEIVPHATRMILGEPGDVTAATDFATRIGPASRLLAQVEPAMVDDAKAALHACMAGLDGPDGIALDGAVWLVSARP